MKIDTELLEKLKTNQVTELEHIQEYDFVSVANVLDVLKTNANLEKLNLYNSNLRESDMTLLSEALANNPKICLQVLNLSKNFLAYDRYSKSHIMRSFFEALQRNVSLKELDLSLNGLSIGCIQHLADALKANNSLKKLIIRNNNFPTDIKNINGHYHFSILPLAEAFKENKALEYLDLAGNSISLKDLQALAEGIETNKTLKYLFIDSTPALLESDAWKKLQQHLEANRQADPKKIVEPEVITPSSFTRIFSFAEGTTSRRGEKRGRKPLKSETFVKEFLTSKRFKI